ncbi:MAG: T9SS type A sorting domain-containing protein [Vicingaceae bacterium]
MNIKSILFGSFAIGLAIGGTVLVNSQEENAVYSPRISSANKSHAGHAEYMHMLRQDPATGIVDPELVAQARNEVMARSKTNKKSAIGFNWVQQGPDNVGGRTRAILIDKDNPNIVYAGSVTGGLFVSTNGAISWSPVSGMQGLSGENLAISCITQTANGRIFFGTGATFEGAYGNGGSGAIGNGVYEYIPSTGAVVPVVTNATSLPNNNTSSFWSATNAIGSYGNRLYIGTKSGLRYASPNGSGNYPTSISSWTNPLEVLPGVAETGVVQDIDIAADGTMLVSFAGKAYRSNPGATGFSRINPAMMTGGARWSGAIAPSDPSVMYMLRSDGTMRGLNISVDRGITWDEIVPAGVSTGTPANKDPFVQNDGTGGQGGYDDAIAINPGDWGHVIVGGVQLYEWKHTAGASDPTLGSWFKSALLNEFVDPSLYVHADKHTIVWQNSTTVYIGSDGGVAKSTDAGQSWQSRNLGYNVTTFYDMNISANGYILGGAQDNGTQLVSFGDFGGLTPLGATEIQGGDGFDCAFSNFGGIAYATSQNGSLQRYSGASGSGFYNAFLDNLVNTVNQPFHTVIENWENRNDQTSLDSVIGYVGPAGLIINQGDTVFPGDVIPAGDTIKYPSLTNNIELAYVVPSNITLGTPTDTIKLIDPVQNRFVTRTTAGVYLTRDAARLNALAYFWFKISNRNDIENFEFSPDGNHLFMGTSNGSVYRVSNLGMVNNQMDQATWDATLTETQIGGGLGGVVSIAVDPNNADNIIATSTGYTAGNHVYRCTDATTATGAAGTFTQIQGAGATSLPKMPVYDAEIMFQDNDKVVVGTEWGVWTTDNAFSAASGSSVQWTDESGSGMAHVQVFSVEQQMLDNWESTNSGTVYLGTHGRGFYKAEDLGGINVAVEENEEELTEAEGFASSLALFPNPMTNDGTLSFKINENVQTTVKIFNLSGALVKTIDLGFTAQGEHKQRIDASDLSVGSYILTLEAGSERKVTKFIVTR